MTLTPRCNNRAGNQILQSSGSRYAKNQTLRFWVAKYIVDNVSFLVPTNKIFQRQVIMNMINRYGGGFVA